MEVNPDSRYLKNFIEFYHKDIELFFPSYLFKPKNDQLIVFVLRNMVPVGLLIVKSQEDTAEIFLDFVIPGYRDFRSGKFLFEESAGFFAEKGIKQLVSVAGNIKHETYLKRIGFKYEGGRYVRLVSGDVIKETTM